MWTESDSDCVVLPMVQEYTKPRVERNSEPTHQHSVTLSTTYHSQALLSTAVVNIIDYLSILTWPYLAVAVLLINESISSYITEILQTQLFYSVFVRGLNNQYWKITLLRTNNSYTTVVNYFIMRQFIQLIPTTKNIWGIWYSQSHSTCWPNIFRLKFMCC